MEVPSSWEDQTGFSCWDVEQRMGDAENPKLKSSFLWSKGAPELPPDCSERESEAYQSCPTLVTCGL